MKVITIGRSSKSDIPLHDETEKISRLHAELHYKPDGSLVLIDKSANGTWVNGERIQRGREFFVRRTDHISFAGRADLNWKEVPDFSQVAYTNVGTNFLVDMRHIVEEVVDYGVLRRAVLAFWNVLRGGADQVLAMADDQRTSRTEAVSYYCLGLVSGVVVENNSFLPTLFGDWGSNPVVEVAMSVLLAMLTFLFAAFNYKVFKWLNHSVKHWRNYFRMFCYTFGTCFWLLTLTLLPLMLIHFITGADLNKLAYLILGAIAVWTVWIWVRANIEFW